MFIGEFIVSVLVSISFGEMNQRKFGDAQGYVYQVGKGCQTVYIPTICTLSNGSIFGILILIRNFSTLNSTQAFTMPMADPLEVDRIQMRIMKAKAEMLQAQRTIKEEDKMFAERYDMVKQLPRQSVSLIHSVSYMKYHAS